jgi:hypothetical protein
MGHTCVIREEMRREGKKRERQERISQIELAIARLQGELEILMEEK